MPFGKWPTARLPREGKPGLAGAAGAGQRHQTRFGDKLSRASPNSRFRPMSGVSGEGRFVGARSTLADNAKPASWARMACSRSCRAPPGSRASSSTRAARGWREGGERVGLAAGAIEGEDQALAEALAQRVFGDEWVELGDDPRRGGRAGSSASRRCSSALRRSSSRRATRSREGLVGEVGERRAPPERQRLAEGCCRGSGGPSSRASGAERLEAP